MALFAPAMGQNTKGDRPMDNQRTIRRTEGKTVKKRSKASTRDIAIHVSPWPNAADGAPVAFIVEHGGSCYAVPNVIKPARLPQDWFNRSEFGVNDEIQRIVSLPRLRRRGNDYEVAMPGVFAR